MRSCIVLVAFFAACGSKDELAPDDMSAVDQASACAQECPGGCPTGQICYKPSATSGFNAFCTIKCTSTTECPSSDQKCLDILTENQPTVCASWEVPDGCPNVDWSAGCFPPAAACDGDILTRPISWPINNVCGIEHVRCGAGCSVGPVDGGASVAHCN